MPTTIVPATDSRSGRMRRFVAYSILAHLGAGLAWGLPSLIKRLAEQERTQNEQKLAEHFRKEEVKTKEHVRQQQIEQTRKEVEKELRKEFDKLTAALSEPKREELWKSVVEKTKPEATNFAEALGKSDTPEQDLRTLEAELRRAMIDNLNDELNAASAREMADRFLDQVESQVAPELASTMAQELKDRVAQKMREEAEQLIAKQREAAQKAREQAANSLREAAAKIDAANNATKQASDSLVKSQAAAKQTGDQAATEAKNSNKQASQQIEQAKVNLGEANASIDKAVANDQALETKTQEKMSAADKAIDAARDAVSKAATAVQEKSADAATAAASAQQATAAAQQATKQAMDAVAEQGDRAALASAAVRAAAESALSKDVEQALTKDLTSTTLPRLAGKLQEAFKEDLASNGMSDEALVEAVGKEIQERLAKSVPALAKSGEKSVSAKLGDVGSAAHDAKAPTLGDSALDKALTEAIAGIGAKAVKRVGELTSDASHDSNLVQKATNGMHSNKDSSKGDEAAMAGLRDTVGAMSRSMKSGRLGSAGGGVPNGAMVSGLRQGAVSRSRHMNRNEKAYAELTEQIAERGAVQGEHWAHEGAQGETSQAVTATGDVPARVVGESMDHAKSILSNDQPYAPTFKSLAFTTVPYFNGQFRIDGNAAKWEALPAIALKPENDADRTEQVLKLAWSNAGLFFYLKVNDSNHQFDKTSIDTFWEGDVIELWVDAYNTKEKYRARHLGQQFWVWPDGSNSDATLTGGEAVCEAKGNFKYVPFHADKIERWAAKTPEGWVMEARIPASVIVDADMSAGRILGFNVHLNTLISDSTGWFWSAGDKVHTSEQPDTWGDLLLAGSDAKIEVLSGQEDAGKRVLGVGSPLQLRVTDGDMDLDPSLRDKVMVTLKHARGDSQIAVLEETGNSTSIFEGAVTTALALDEPVPAVLSVYEGERIEIIYVDQARANGAREAQVSTAVSFGSAIMAHNAALKIAQP